MSDPDQINIKRRLAGEGRPPPEIGRMTPETALKLALARACENSLSLEVFAKSVEMRRSVISDLVDQLPENALISLLHGPMNRLGLAIFDGQMLGGVIEKQTTGRVVPNPAAERAATRTDAVMCADLITDVLKAFQVESEEAVLPLTPSWSGFEYVMPLEDARAIQMAMEDIPYRLFDVQLDLEKGAKQGRILLAFPFAPPHATPVRAPEGDDEMSGMMAEVVQDTTTRMEAVLHRCEMTLSQVTGLEVGTLLPIPSESIVQINLEDILGEKVSYGALGAKSGHRAIRINLNPPSPEQLVAVAPHGGEQAAPSAPMAGGATEMDLPAIGGLSDIPGGIAIETEPAGLPDLPDMPAMGDLSAMGDGGGLPPLEGMGDLPPMGDLPAMGDLPPLDGAGDLPDLPDLGELGSMD